ncbi:MAG: hypothetical protein AAB421_03875 [Patescibacteria group bacterium]
MDTNPAPTYPRKHVLWATGGALLVAAALLVLVVLPAQYKIDPTGIGEALGLTKLAPTIVPEAALGFTPYVWPYEQAEESITIQPRQGLEFKFSIERGNPILYTWSSTDVIYYEFHAEPTTDEGKEYLPFASYEKGTAALSSGYLLTKFTGRHGWYWRNDSAKPITVILKASGYYGMIGVIDPNKKAQ